MREIETSPQYLLNKLHGRKDETIYISWHLHMELLRGCRYSEEIAEECKLRNIRLEVED